MVHPHMYNYIIIFCKTTYLGKYGSNKSHLIYIDIDKTNYLIN